MGATPSPAPPDRDAAGRTRRAWRRLRLVVVLLLINVLGAWALDRIGLVESLLSPSGPRTAMVLPLAILFYAARLFVLFIGPGLAAGALIDLALDRARSRRD